MLIGSVKCRDQMSPYVTLYIFYRKLILFLCIPQQDIAIHPNDIINSINMLSWALTLWCHDLKCSPCPEKPFTHQGKSRHFVEEPTGSPRLKSGVKLERRYKWNGLSNVRVLEICREKCSHLSRQGKWHIFPQAHRKCPYDIRLIP